MAVAARNQFRRTGARQAWAVGLGVTDLTTSTTLQPPGADPHAGGVQEGLGREWPTPIPMWCRHRRAARWWHGAPGAPLPGRFYSMFDRSWQVSRRSSNHRTLHRAAGPALGASRRVVGTFGVKLGRGRESSTWRTCGGGGGAAQPGAGRSRRRLPISSVITMRRCRMRQPCGVATQWSRYSPRHS